MIWVWVCNEWLCEGYHIKRFGGEDGNALAVVTLSTLRARIVAGTLVLNCMIFTILSSRPIVHHLSQKNQPI